MSVNSPNYFKTNDNIMLKELEDTAEKALKSHVTLKDAKEWHPCEVVPFEKATYAIDIDDATKSAIFINGLTEDNLAHYTSTLKRLFGREGVWGEWNNRWTWEESLHGRAIERYIEHTDLFDAEWLEEARKSQLTSGNVPEPDTISEIAIYTTIQEELTRLAHSRLSQRLSGIGKKLFALIAGDELRHHHFYNSVASAIRERYPDEFTSGLSKIIKRFEMPGLGIPLFKEHSEDIEHAGIFTTQDIANTIGRIASKYWEIDNLTDEVKEDQSKFNSEKIQRRIATYRRLASLTIDKKQDYKARISWLNGVATPTKN